MPDSQRAFHRVRGQIRAQPALLWRSGTHRDVAVQYDDVPGPELVAVVTFRRIVPERAEISEVSRGVRGAVLVIPERRLCAALVAAPARPVAALEPPRRAVLVGVVPSRKHRAGNSVQQIGGRFVGGAGTGGDVAGTGQDNGWR